VTNDWAGIAVALVSGHVDVAWMGPWGYVIAHNQGAGDAIATAKYDGKPVYHAIVIARPDLQIGKWPAKKVQDIVTWNMDVPDRRGYWRLCADIGHPGALRSRRI
jgi:ABC-type phosphate/phosphonate transport system substrate-binding protein